MSILRVGQKAPSFDLPGADGKRYQLRGLIAEGPLTMFFVRSTT
jgi:peroxiredoxin